nr:PRO2206 [Homo sapiens]
MLLATGPGLLQFHKDICPAPAAIPFPFTLGALLVTLCGPSVHSSNQYARMIPTTHLSQIWGCALSSPLPLPPSSFTGFWN